jgi:hypothetical protein
MRWDRLGAALLSPARRLRADWTAVCLAVAAAAGAAALFTPPPTAFAVLFLALALIRPLTTACEAAPGPARKIMGAYAAVLATAGLVCVTCMGVGTEKDQVKVLILLVVGGLFGSLGSAGIARDVEKRFPGKTA